MYCKSVEGWNKGTIAITIIEVIAQSVNYKFLSNDYFSNSKNNSLK